MSAADREALAPDPDDPRLAPFRDLRAAVRRRRTALAGRVPVAAAADAPLVVEGEIPVGRLLAAGLAVDVLLLTPSHAAALRALLEAAVARGTQVVLASAAQIRAVTGGLNALGCLAAAPRPALPQAPADADVERWRAHGRSTVLVAERIADPTNLGLIVRNARAFGVDLLLTDAHGADPLDPRAVRTSAGHVFSLPLCVAPDVPATVAALRARLGGTLLAATTARDARPAERCRRPPHLLLAVGSEGEGLSRALLDAADGHVTVRLAPGVDSLNVAAATAVLLHALR